MPFCENCGRRLAENEVCDCQNNPVPPPMIQPQPAVYNTVVQAPKKKSGVGVVILIIAIILIVFVLIVGGILAAILVPAMLGYTKKSKFASINSTSSSIYKAANSILVEMDEDGYKLEGYYIISSDTSYNYNVPSSFDTDVFYDGIDVFFEDADNYKWFIVVENGYASYAAASEGWNARYTGSYPAGSNFTPRYYNDSYSSSSEEDRNLNKLYNDAIDKVFDLSMSSTYEDSYYYY